MTTWLSRDKYSQLKMNRVKYRVEYIVSDIVLNLLPKFRVLTPQGQLSVEQTFFPFGLKWKPLLWRYVMISVKSSSPKVKSMNSSFIKNMNIFDIFYHFPQFEHNKSEVWKGKNLCARGVKNELNSFFYDMVIIWTEAYANNTSIQIPIKHIVKYAAEDFIQRQELYNL